MQDDRNREDQSSPVVGPDEEISDRKLVNTQALIEEYESESPTRQFLGPVGWIVGGIAVGLSLYALYSSRATIPMQVYRTSFLGIALVLTFLLYPWRRGASRKINIIDIGLAVAAIVVSLYPLTLSLTWFPLDIDQDFVRRAARPTEMDVWMGAILIILVLEATRRTVGWILPAFSVALLAYAHWGNLFPGDWGHRGYDLDRIVGTMYITLEGIFGTALDVAATYIVLFTIYGAVLEFSGAGKFFLDFSFAATGRRASGAGRTATIAGFLLGTVSGSGVATTVTLGSVAWPMLRKAGYTRDSAGAVLSAGGIGAILSPPTLGAAAFLIAEYVQISYLDVIKMAMIPTILYYLCIFLMIELDSRKMNTRAVIIETLPAGTLVKRYWYHFTSLIAIIVLMVIGFTPLRAVVYATGLAFLLSFLRRDTAMTPNRTWNALRGGAVSTLSVASTCATAGIIVGVMTLTGLGLKMSDLIVDLANERLFLTVLYTGLAVWVLGLAVPVTASYIIAAAITAPALISMGVPDVAVHMFIFYYAVLSEVSPPTALSPFAAAAITGGNPFKTMMLTWKYTLPAFVVPFMFTLNRENGINLLALGGTGEIILSTVTACLAIVALVAGVGGWIIKPATWLERAILVVAAGLLLYTGPVQDLTGAALLVVGIAVHVMRTRGGSEAGPTPAPAV
jgi:TRAP transporter 4TM/12TM fusion protein